MVWATIIAGALALASADEQASLLQTRKRNSNPTFKDINPILKDMDVMMLLDSFIDHPQSVAEELVGAEVPIQQALMQRAMEKPRQLQILDRVLGLPPSKKHELLQAAKGSTEVSHLIHSLSQQSQLDLIEMSKADSVDAAIEAKGGLDSVITKKINKILNKEDPDVRADMVQIVTKHGYPIETHEVTTDDGYILTNFRIPHGKASNATGSKKVVFLQHALLCSSFDWVANAPSQSLGFLLADAGFDVWFGNNRGDSYSLKHRQFARKSDEFWNFTYDEMAKYDLPAQINYALRVSGRSSLGYVGHSQGTLQAFAGLSSNQEIASKVDLFAALAPVAWVHHQKSPVFSAMAHFKTSDMFKKFGIREFATQGSRGASSFMNKMGAIACQGPFDKLCNHAIFLFCGKTTHINASRIDVYLAHTPAGTSVKNMDQWSQGVLRDNFQRYSYPTEEENLAAYGQATPPAYNVRDLNVKTALFTGGNDILVDPEDLQNILDNAPNIVSHKHIEDYGHLDFAWAHDADEYVYRDVKALLHEHVQ